MSVYVDTAVSRLVFLCLCTRVGGAGESPVVFSGVAAAVPQRGLPDPGGALSETGPKVSEVIPGRNHLFTQ